MATSVSSEIVRDLTTDGIARLPSLVSPETLREMQAAFAVRLGRLRWNDQDGYERTERFRHMVQDVLTLAQGFVDVALHPLVKDALREYLGEEYELVEAKGWKSLPTHRDFHGWHGDGWYDQELVTDRVPREVKLAFYLTDVRSGAFQYVKGTHGKQAPRAYYGKPHDGRLPTEQLVEMLAPAGTAFLFDTSGIHRQACPIREPRQAVFLNFHDPSVPLRREDIDYYRYHPLLLNAAFLGDLSAEDRRILGFGNKCNYVPAYQRKASHARFQAIMRTSFGLKLAFDEFRGRILRKAKRILGQN
jgi:hypothetical protein